MALSCMSSSKQIHNRLLTKTLILDTYPLKFSFDINQAGSGAVLTSGTTQKNEGNQPNTDLTATVSTLLGQTPARLGTHCYYNPTTTGSNFATIGSFTIPASFTLCFFYKTNATSNGCAFSMYNSSTNADLLYLFVATNNQWQCQFGSAGGIFPVSPHNKLQSGMTTWEHFAISYNRSTYKVYINGAVSLSGTRANAASGINTIRIGNKGPTSAAGGIYPGYIDDFRLYSGILTDAQVLAIAQQ